MINEKHICFTQVHNGTFTFERIWCLRWEEGGNGRDVDEMTLAMINNCAEWWAHWISLYTSLPTFVYFWNLPWEKLVYKYLLPMCRNKVRNIYCLCVETRLEVYTGNSKSGYRWSLFSSWCCPIVFQISTSVCVILKFKEFVLFCWGRVPC